LRLQNLIKKIFFVFSFTVIFFFSMITLVQSQEKQKINISGTVIDESSKEPLANVNVFLSNTALGDVTDAKGIFTIERVPLGAYELVVSMIGYELQTIRIYLNQQRDKEYHFKLKVKYLKGKEISVNATFPKEWKNHLKKFENLFLGKSKNASKCKILNPEYINFEYDEATGLLTASASEPIKIENRALGYIVNYYLLDFASIEDGEMRYLGRIKFDSLPPKNEKEKEKWDKNRFATFNGSYRHFLSALANGKLFEEGFKIFGILKTIINGKTYYLDRVSSDTLLAPSNQEFERKLSFPNSLTVVYKDQTSTLEMREPSVTINTLGQIYNPYALTTYGLWTKKRIADKLPLDYERKTPKND